MMRVRKEKEKPRVKLKGGLDLRAQVGSLDCRCILHLMCHLIGEVIYRCHLDLQGQVGSFKDSLDQYLMVLNRVGARDFLLPFQLD